MPNLDDEDYHWFRHNGALPDVAVDVTDVFIKCSPVNIQEKKGPWNNHSDGIHSHELFLMETSQLCCLQNVLEAWMNELKDKIRRACATIRVKVLRNILSSSSVKLYNRLELTGFISNV
jgi:hypothetical protein